jgi:hypothetical protein
VLPSVALKQLQALDCIDVAGGSYLRIDTSIDCDSPEFRSFRAVNGLFATAYLTMPLVWLALLCVHREQLNPLQSTRADRKLVIFLRDHNDALAPLRFLFGAYRPPVFFMEVAEM